MSTEETQPTLRETLVNSISQHSEVPEELVVTTQAESTPEPVSAEPAKPGRTAGRPRDEHGKLLPGKPAKSAAAQESAAEPQKPVDPTSTNQAQPETQAAAPEQQEPAVQRPSSWRKEMWQHWDKLTPEVQKYVAQREAQFATGVSTYKNIADNAKPVLDAIAPFQADLERHGIQAPDMVHRLMSAHKSLAMGSPHEKLGMFTQLAQQYGIPIQALYDPNVQQQYLAQPHVPQQQAPAPQKDIATTIEEILTQREVKQTVDSMARNQQQYPFFNYLRSDMSQLLETGEAEDLEDAYAKALDLPQHSMLTSFRQQPEPTLEQQVAQQKQGAARAARASAVSPKSATPAPAAPPSGKQSVRDSLRDAIAAHVGGGRV